MLSINPLRQEELTLNKTAKHMAIAAALVLTTNLWTSPSLAAAPTLPSSAPASVTPLHTVQLIDLPSGEVTVYDYGTIKLHAYATKDALNDEAYILEGKTNLVAIEMPSFTKDLESWKDYAASLNKPLNDVFIADHPAGASYVKGMTIYGTQGAKDAITSGVTFAITDGLYKSFGSDFHGGSDMIHINRVVPAGDLVVGCIQFRIIDRGYTYDLVIPAIHAIYTHMLGKTTHSILTSTAHMDAMTAILKEYQQAGYALILSAHSVPEGQDAVAEKIAYIQKAKELTGQCRTAAEFIAAMKEQFPMYDGENYLEMTAANLYPSAQ